HSSASARLASSSRIRTLPFWFALGSFMKTSGTRPRCEPTSLAWIWVHSDPRLPGGSPQGRIRTGSPYESRRQEFRDFRWRSSLRLAPTQSGHGRGGKIFLVTFKVDL